MATTKRTHFLLRGLTVFFTVLMAVTLCVPVWAAPTMPEQAKAGDTVILHTNDTHGRVDENMGFTAVAALKNAYEDAGATVLVLDAGDTLHGKPVFNMSRGENAVKVMNAVGYDAMTPGNHDFNYGADRLKELSAKMKFPLLAANVTQMTAGKSDKEGPGGLIHLKDKPFAQNHVILTKNGKKYGVFGLATPETMFKSNPANLKNIKFGDPIAAAKTEVKALQKEKVDYIIAVAHIGLDKSTEITSDKIAAAVPGIDVIIDGHSHTELADGMAVGNTLIASTGEYMNNVGVVTITADGKKSAGLVNKDLFEGHDETVDAIVKEMVDATNKELNVAVGHTDVLLDGEREHVRTSETNLGNLITDAILAETKADIAFENGGGVRVSIPAGDITKAQILEVLPFANYVVVKTMTGAQILEVLEHGVSDYPATSGGFPQVAGLTFQFDPEKPAGQRVFNVQAGGKALDLKAAYTFAVNDFTAVGGDGYEVFKSAPTVAQFGNMDEIVMNFLTAHKDYVAKVDGRITTGTKPAQQVAAEEAQKLVLPSFAKAA